LNSDSDTDTDTDSKIPQGHQISLTDRGDLYIRYRPAPAGAPTVVLLHGWTATADLNFFPAYGPVAAHFGVLAFDQRGHGRGIRSRKPFRLTDCADDVAAVLDKLGIERAIIVGYSMGGAIAQLTWRRHPDRVLGLVLAATSSTFRQGSKDQLGCIRLNVVAVLSRLAPMHIKSRVAERFLAHKQRQGWQAGGIDQLRTHEWTAVLEAGGAIMGFSSRLWVSEIDVPVAVIINTADATVPTSRQEALAAALPRSQVFRVNGAHDVCVNGADRWVPALIEAITHVAQSDPVRR
jgi:3-oxoadipate enol-lactonase